MRLFEIDYCLAQRSDEQAILRKGGGHTGEFVYDAKDVARAITEAGLNKQQVTLVYLRVHCGLDLAAVACKMGITLFEADCLDQDVLDLVAVRLAMIRAEKLWKKNAATKSHSES